MSNDKIADLKAKFVAGAIPHESDYATLLNMLEETRAATGTSPDAPKSASLKLSNEGYLDVAVAADGGLVTGASGLSTDARLLWARNHAISTGASQYGIWDGGYAFIYILKGNGKRQLQFCVEDIKDNPPYIENGYGFALLDENSNLITAEWLPLTDEVVDGWTDRGYGFGNTIYFDDFTQKKYYYLDFTAGSFKSNHNVKLTLLTV